MNSTDLLVRKQLITKKIAELGGIYADDLRLGKKCAIEHRNDILLLEGVIDLICSVNIEGSSSGVITITTLDISYSDINIYSGTTSITGDFIITSASSLVEIIYQINEYQTKYKASIIDSNHIKVYTTDCTDENKLSYRWIFSGGTSLSFTGMTSTGCSVSTNSCITEDELKTLLDNISEKYNICFQPYGFSYQSN